MSSPIHHPDDLDPALRYAPPRIRDQMPDAPPASAAPPVDWPWRREFDEPTEASEERAIMPVQMRRSLEPEWLPEPPLAVAEHRDWLRMIMRTAGLFGFAAAVAWVVVSIPGARRLGTELVQASFSGATVATGIDSPGPSVAAKTRSEAPYGQDGTTIAVRTSRHRPVTRDLAVAPPAAGMAMQGSTSIQPTPPLPPAPALPAAAAEAPASAQPAEPGFVTRQMDRDEMQAMFERAQGLIKTGDLSSARLLLRRVAEAGNVQAALTLAGTFDPNVLRTLGLQDAVADVSLARLWYERAEKFGSTEAPRRLQQLATMSKPAE